VSVGVDSRALVWKLGEFNAGLPIAKQSIGRGQSASDRSSAAVQLQGRPAHELANLIDSTAEVAPIDLDDEPCDTESAATRAGMELAACIELQVGDVGGTAVRSIGAKEGVPGVDGGH